MTRRFCDICDAPVLEREVSLETKTPWGKKYLGVDAGSPTNSMKQCSIVTLCKLIKIESPKASVGTQNLLAGIADESEVRQYKLKQRTLS